jgi:hypothetical protein
LFIIVFSIEGQCNKIWALCLYSLRIHLFLQEFYLYYTRNSAEVNESITDLVAPEDDGDDNNSADSESTAHLVPPEDDGEDNNSADSNNSTDELIGWRKYFYVFKKVWVQLINIIIIYMVSLSIFPALQANIKSSNDIINDTYFTPVTCFLSFNFFAMMGNLVAHKFQKPGPRYIIIFVLLRILFIPFFLLCNYIPDERKWRVIFSNDWIYLSGGILFALTSGYFASLSIMYAPRCVERKYASTAGMMAALTIILGILLGLNFSLVYPFVVLI